MFGRAIKSTILCLALMGASEAFCAPLNNDFTKANKSTSELKDKPQSHLQDDKYREENKEFKAAEYVPPPDRHDLKGRQYRGSDSAVASQLERKRYDFDKNYTPPQLNIFDENFHDRDKQARIEKNSLNKDYAGTIDFDKRNPNDAYMKEFLAHTQEKSMQEINKYVFRSSHSSDPGVKSFEAGSQLHSDKDDSSELVDFLFGTKRVSRSPINFKKNKSVGTVSTANVSGAPSSASQGQNAPARLAPNVRILPPVVNGQRNVSNNRPQERKVKVAEKEVDMGSTNLFAPRAQGMSTGKYKIKVEVSNPQ